MLDYSKLCKRGNDMFQERIGLAVWLTTLKHTRQLRRFGNVLFVSKKLKYAVIYCSRDDVEQTMERIQSLHFVRSVELSLKPFVKTTFENSKPDKAKQYDYKMEL